MPQPSRRPLGGPWCVVLLLECAVLAGCGAHRPLAEAPLPVALPARFVEAPATDSAAPLEPASAAWWQTFADGGFAPLVQEALGGNLDLRAAAARFVQATAVARRTAAAQGVQVGLAAGATRQRSVFLLSEQLAPGRPPAAFLRDQFDLAVAPSYEVDLWERLGAQAAADRLDARAGRDDLETASRALAAAVVDAALLVVEQRQQAALLDEQLAVGRTFLELIEFRLGQGQASALDLLQQRQLLAATRARRPQVRGLLALHEHRLAVLCGEAPGAPRPPLPEVLPQPPGLPAAGLPLLLLTRRPDVRAAHLRVLSADRRVGVAVADRFPSLSLRGSTGYTASSAGDLFRNWIWSLGPSLVQPLLDSGRRRAEVRRARAVVDERLASYGQTFLRALQEVEDALSSVRHGTEYLAELDAQMDVARATLDEAKVRYVNGLNDYLPVLTALQSLQQAERTRLAAHQQVLSSHVTLCRALGGAPEVSR